jgi:hypothetical protein
MKQIYEGSFSMMFSCVLTQREADNKHRFYTYNYPAENYSLINPEDTTFLSFTEHCRCVYT